MRIVLGGIIAAVAASTSLRSSRGSAQAPSLVASNDVDPFSSIKLMETGLQAGKEGGKREVMDPMPPSMLSSPPVMPFASLDTGLYQLLDGGIHPLPPVESTRGDWLTNNALTAKEIKDSTELLYANQPPPIPDIAGRLASPQNFLLPRYDSSNPYCDICIMAVNSLSRKAEGTPEEICKEGYPIGMKDKCEPVVKALKENADYKLIVDHGCVDKTSPLLSVMEKGKCSGLVACNIIEDASGTPMCGFLRRGWGDYIDADAINRPLRPHNYGMNVARDVEEARPVEGGHLPTVIVSNENPNCDICIDIMNAVTAAGDVASPTACNLVPVGSKDRCDRFATALKANEDAKKLASSGCIDLTAVAATESAKCPGVISCNIILDKIGGPICGGSPRSLGKMK